MNEIKINEINNQLPIWNLSEIYKDIKDPNIGKDIKEISKLSKEFLKKWKGRHLVFLLKLQTKIYFGL